MKLTKATKSPKKCNGFKGCGGNIYTGFRYVELKPKRGKFLCESCYNKSRLDKDTKFFNELIKKVG